MRVEVLGAGGPAGVNVCRALHAAGHEVYARDDDLNHLVWCQPFAETRPGMIAQFSPADATMAQPDNLVLELAQRQAAGERITSLLPKPQTILLCQDKFECGLAFRRAGLREDQIQAVESEVGKASPWQVNGEQWIRARYGAGARAASHTADRIEALMWMSFWACRNVREFVAEDYLPGRDYSWCGVYADGELLVSFARERLEYLYPHLSPDGKTGTPTRAVVVEDDRIDEMAELAVIAVDDEPHGVFCVDLREDSEGQPRPTEINAGRFSTTVGLWSLYSPATNFVALAAELALSDRSRLDGWEDLPPGLTLSRHIDCPAVFTMAPERKLEVVR